MREFFDQVAASADANLYFVALFGALSIPDICAALDSEDGRTDSIRYKAWFDTFVAPRYTVGPNQDPSFSGEDAWGLRCSIMHQGTTQPHKGMYSRVLFVEPGHGFVMHNNVMNDALNLDVRLFCSDVVVGARAWLAKAEGTALYQKNYPSFLQRYADGFPPYIVGVPVLT
jgi:hypothetical protein